MPRDVISHGKLSLVCVQPEHIESIRQWRNSQMPVLRQKSEISPQEQEEYFETQIWATLNNLQPDNILLAYLREGMLIGYGGLVHMAWQDSRAEVSFLLDTAKADASLDYAQNCRSFLSLICEFAFEDLKLNRLFTETWSTRRVHLQALDSAGFRREGVLKQHTIQCGVATDSVIHARLAAEDRKTQ